MTNRADAAASWLAEQANHMEEALAALVEVNSFTGNVEGGRKPIRRAPR
jgi:glutamate carboxypeptidase